MSSLGLLAQDSGGRLALTGRPRPGRRRIAILGAGVSGMSAAYELGKLGFDCTVLEARGRPGGRNWTVRRGTVEAELGRPPQTCRFDPGLFMNAGPMRISLTHSTSLAYCRELGVPLIPFPMVNEACYVYAPGFKRMRLREVHADWVGYTAELLAKAVNQDKLDLALSSADRRQLIETLRQAGFLNSSLTYPDDDPPAGLQLGSDDSPRGFVTLPGTVGDPVQPTRPVPFDTLIRSGYVGQTGLIPGELDWQPTMLTPEGGMDRLAYAFANKLGGVIRYRAVVTAARRTSAAGVRLTYTDLADTTGGAGGTPKELTADFCLCTLPPGILAGLPADFAPATRAALAAPRAAAAGKIGLQFRRRFWELDDEIYGGISYSAEPITQIVYPFDGFGTPKGVLLGYYHFGNARHELNDQPLARREQLALAQGAHLHPQYANSFENSFSVAWDRIPHNRMSWVEWDTQAQFEATLKTLDAPDGPFLFAGDWLTHLNGWQAGAFASAQRAVAKIHQWSMS